MPFKGYSFREISTSNTSFIIKRLIIFIIVIALVVGGIFAYFYFREAGRVFGYYRVSNVIDGDTIEIDKDGETVRIRLIGIDTPETVDPDKQIECYGPEASEYTKNRLFDKFVKIETDSSQGKYDKYNRLLAYIFTDDSNFNKELIEKGYAREYTYNKPYKYQEEFREAERRAKNEKAGLWSPIACPTSDEGDSPQAQSNSQPQDCNIKGNISNYTGEKIYHVPGQKYYDDTYIEEDKGERWFCSEEEAVAAGWRRSKE